MFGVLLPKEPVNTNFAAVSDTQLQLFIENLNEMTTMTIFDIQAPPLAEGYAYSVYIQQGKLDPVYLGQLTSKVHSISQTVSHLIKNRENPCIGYISIALEPEMPVKPDEFDDREKLNQVGQIMVDDMFRYVSSYEDVYFQGDHYVPYTAVQQWLALVDARIKYNEKFWSKLQ